MFKAWFILLLAFLRYVLYKQHRLYVVPYGGLRRSLCLKAHSHCAFFSDCDCNLVLLVMGQKGVGDVMVVA